MMMGFDETVDGITYAVKEIDDEIATHIPELKRRVGNRCMVESGVDALLDMRNDLTAVLGDIAINEMEGEMQ